MVKQCSHNININKHSKVKQSNHNLSMNKQSKVKQSSQNLSMVKQVCFTFVIKTYFHCKALFVVFTLFYVTTIDGGDDDDGMLPQVDAQDDDDDDMLPQTYAPDASPYATDAPDHVEPDEAYHSGHSDDEVKNAPENHNEFEEFVNKTNSVYMDVEANELHIPEVQHVPLIIGMHFRTVYDVKFYLRTHAIIKKFVYSKYMLNDSNRVRVKCIDPNYKRFAYVKQKTPNSNFKLKTLKEDQTCQSDAT